MSRNPYLAASRPTSSFTRSSRTSKKNDLSSGSLLGRSRSSAALSGLSISSAYSSAAGYTPSWQRSTSTSRALNRQGSDLSSSYKASDYTPSSQQQISARPTPSSYQRSSLYKSTSSSNLTPNAEIENDDENVETSEHLKNYQQSKMQQSQTGRLPIQSPDNTKDNLATRSTTSLDSSGTELSYDDSESLPRSGIGAISSSVPRHLRNQGNLLKSQSLDIGQQQQLDTATLLSGTMSVDRLLLRSESMTERELRKSYKELVMENERLKKHLKALDDKEKQKSQDWIRKERQLERKISELEEENKSLEQWKQESQRLKDENSSLIRVLSKLSKKQN